LGSSTARASANAPTIVATVTRVGALALARAVDDPKLSDALRDAALQHLTPNSD
jgi:hypothetical protein